ncbi:bile acid:sodium symporter family protein [Oceanospirillum sanctuarii]|uniref:bile acid:sodium symporter family protein n=1 Tax=Oceanospirillum sanctuarii TaxID=1434821 RepID=UPI000A36B03E|nr:bile acid:sodium symporter family protein [Oceanospirillum sanctuarii]
MSNGILLGVVLPAALFIIMLGMGMTLRPADFGRVFTLPRAVLVGLTGQMLFVPLLAFGVVTLFQLPPELAVGLMVLSFAPGGATSNMMTFLSRGDVALSITLTAFASVITPFTMPLLTQLSLDHWMGSSQPIELPIAQTMLRLFVITVVPVSIGMWLHGKKPELSQKLAKVVKPLSIGFLAMVIIGIVAKHWTQMPDFLAAVGWPVIVLNSLALGLGYLFARVNGLNVPQQLTIGIEVGVQNGGTALLVTGAILGNSVMSVPPVIYGILMWGPSMLFGLWWGKRVLNSQQTALGQS